MASTPIINLDKVIRRTLLDIALLKWFATIGGRKVAVQWAIRLAMGGRDPTVLDFLEHHINPKGTQ